MYTVIVLKTSWLFSGCSCACVVFVYSTCRLSVLEAFGGDRVWKDKIKIIVFPIRCVPILYMLGTHIYTCT